MTVLVTGGAGYIGAHMVRALLRRGRSVVVLDNLSTGHRRALHPDAAFVLGDVRDTDAVADVLRDHAVSEIIHFAALIEVRASAERPVDYWNTNFGGTVSVLRAMQRAGVRRIVFSSTCAVYGEPSVLPIPETCERAPISVYGQTKLASEHALADACAADPDLRVIALRYFNVAGASDDGDVGEDHVPETHLIPLVLRSAREGGPPLTVFGTDYATPDGTCVRDYVHVEDLCTAHLAAVDRSRPGFEAFNVGLGRGFSVREVVDAARRITGRPIETIDADRRPGDPAALYADARRARETLGWSPRRDDLDTIVASAWGWARQVSS